MTNPSYLYEKPHGPSYAEQVHANTDWIVDRAHDLAIRCDQPPLIVPINVTFDPMAVRPGAVLREHERFYARFCDLLINNHDRPSKRHLLPFAIAWRDSPWTRPDKYRCRPTLAAILANHPTVAPHVHSVFVIHPALRDRFIAAVESLEQVWRSIPADSDTSRCGTSEVAAGPVRPLRYLNKSLHVDLAFAERTFRLMSAGSPDDWMAVRAAVRTVVKYDSKLCWWRRAALDGDLFNVLPPEPQTASAKASGREPSVAAMAA